MAYFFSSIGLLSIFPSTVNPSSRTESLQLNKEGIIAIKHRREQTEMILHKIIITAQNDLFQIQHQTFR